jgi:cyanophycin synthetase
MDVFPKVGIISGTGDRRDEDIKEVAQIAAEYFDEIIIRQDKYLRGRTVEEIVGLLQQGISESPKPNIPVTIILNEKEAIMHAVSNAKPGSLITLLADKVDASLELIKKLKEEEDKT